MKRTLKVESTSKTLNKKEQRIRCPTCMTFEKMVLDLILAHKIVIQTLFGNEIEMTMSSHGVIAAQDRRVAKIRSKFEDYAKNKT